MSAVAIGAFVYGKYHHPINRAAIAAVRGVAASTQAVTGDKEAAGFSRGVATVSEQTDNVSVALENASANVARGVTRGVRAVGEFSDHVANGRYCAALATVRNAFFKQRAVRPEAKSKMTAAMDFVSSKMTDVASFPLGDNIVGCANSCLQMITDNGLTRGFNNWCRPKYGRTFTTAHFKMELPNPDRDANDGEDVFEDAVEEQPGRGAFWSKFHPEPEYYDEKAEEEEAKGVRDAIRYLRKRGNRFAA